MVIYHGRPNKQIQGYGHLKAMEPLNPSGERELNGPETQKKAASQSYRNSEPFLEMLQCISLQVGPVTSLKWSYGGPVITRVFDPSYPFIRPFIGVLTHL